MTTTLTNDSPEIEHLTLVAKRPKQSTVGTPVNVISNSFPVSVNLDTIHVYHVTFEPHIPEDTIDMRRRVLNEKSIREKLEKSYHHYFFENTRLWSLHLKTGEHAYTNAAVTQTVSIRHIKTIDLKSLTNYEYEQHAQIVHIMLNKVIQATQLTRIGRNYFQKNLPLFGGASELDIRGERGSPNIRMWRGYSMTMEQSISGLQLHCDIVHRVLHQQNVMELIESLFATEMKNGNSREKAQSFVKKKIETMFRDCCVITVYNKRVYRIHEIDWSIGINDTFEKDGQQISYKDYFWNAYGEKCMQKFRGMLVHIPKRKKNAPDRIVLAPELCHMTGLTKSMKSNFSFTRKMADTTRISAKDRHKLGAELVSNLQESIGFENNANNTTSNVQKGKGVATSRIPVESSLLNGTTHQNGVINGTRTTTEVIQQGKKLEQQAKIPLLISKKPVELTGRVLPEFKVYFLKQTKDLVAARPYEDDIKVVANNSTFINKTIIPINRWAIVADRRQDAELCLKMMRQVSVKTGLWSHFLNDSPIVIDVGPSKIIKNERPDNPQALAWKKTLEELIGQHKPQLIVCVLPDARYGNPTAVYNKIKTYCCTENPVLTQCVQSSSLRNQKRVNNIVVNVVKQMFTKIGNIPWKVKIELPDNEFNVRSIPTMVCGMDVNHDMRRNVSTVSFCASYSPDYTKYFTFVHHQAFGREVMIDGANLILQALKKFQSINKCLPKQILIYRDGVSTSQLNDIVMHEVRSYKKAFRTVRIENKFYEPKLSVIVTQKSVSARFLTTNFQSLRPGTLIDSTVVSAHFWDFYVVPCEAPYRGTASPTRFIVAHDDIGFSQGDIAAFTNQLCLLFFNWCGPVRVPAPVQYAHKIAHMFGTAIDQAVPCDILNGRPFYL